MKIKLKNENSFKNLKLSNQKKNSDKIRVKSGNKNQQNQQLLIQQSSLKGGVGNLRNQNHKNENYSSQLKLGKKKAPQSHLSAPREAYSSTHKGEHSAIETSNIMEEKLSDTSFTLNFKEIIGSMDEKNEIEQMKARLQEKDDLI